MIFLPNKSAGWPYRYCMRPWVLVLASLVAVSAFAKGFNAATATNQVGLDLFRRIGGAQPGGNLTGC